MNEENTKNALVPGTLSELFGDRIVILLDELEDHTITEYGVYVPLNEVYETDGGKIKTRTAEQKHLAMGTVLAISAQATKNLATNSNTLSVGDRVYVPPTAVAKQFYFFPERTKLVQDFTGYICVPHTLIEAKI